MPTDLMTVEEAARHLGLSVRTVRSYIARHLLSTRKTAGNRRKWLDPLEVEELRKDHLEAGSGSLEQKHQILELRATVRKLRAEMDLVLRILDIREEPLGLDAQTAGMLFHGATEELRNTAWELPELLQWADIFLRLNEEDLVVVFSVVKTRPWSPFLRLCVDLIAYVTGHPAYKTDVELQLMHKRLTEARRRLRIVAMCYEDLHAADQDRELRRAALLDSPASVREQLLHRAQQKGKKQQA